MTFDEARWALICSYIPFFFLMIALGKVFIDRGIDKFINGFLAMFCFLTSIYGFGFVMVPVNEYAKAQDVRDNKFNLNEGVICKGHLTKGNFFGKMWMCKIKTQAYLDKLKNRFGDDWEKYAE